MSVSKERKEYLLEKFKYAAKEFGKSGTKSNYLAVPKEQQLSIDLGLIDIKNSDIEYFLLIGKENAI